MRTPNHVITRVHLLTVILLCAILTAPISAQSLATVTVTDELVIESGDALLVDVYFSLASPLQATSALIVLEDGSQAEAQIQKPPYYIALVLDASSSMKEVFPAVQAAAIQAVQSAPAEVHFAVLRFDENINLIQPFTNDHSQAIAAINQVQIDEGGTCLYDVAYTAVEALEQISHNAPRRAMILFSDGRDEKRRGLTGACSKNTYDQLLDFAANREVPVPIHTVGLADNQRRINSSELLSLSAATGGFSTVGPGEFLADHFRRIMEEVQGQWMARATLYPTQGQHRGALYLTLSDGSQPLSAPVLFTSSRNYQTPPDPVTVNISNFTYNETADLFLFDVTLTSAQMVGSLFIEVMDDQNNLQVDRLIIPNPGAIQHVRQSAARLTAGRGYTVQVLPNSLAGNAIKGENGEVLSAEYQFRYDPPKILIFNIDSIQIRDEAPQFNLRTWRVEDDQAELTVSLTIENGEEIAQLIGRLINQQGNLQVDSFSLDAPSETIRLPIAIGAGAYTIVTDALAADGARLASARHTFTYTPPEAPFARAVLAWQANPIMSYASLLTLLLVAIVTWRIGVLRGRRAARASSRRSESQEALVPSLDKASASAAGNLPRVRLRVVETPDPSVVNGDGRLLTRFPYTIGREGSDLTISGDQHVSRNHARITFENGVFYIEDMGSSNGTFINDARITAHRPMPLGLTDVGASIRIGKTTRLNFSEESLPESIAELAAEPASD